MFLLNNIFKSGKPSGGKFFKLFIFVGFFFFIISSAYCSTEDVIEESSPRRLFFNPINSVVETANYAASTIVGGTLSSLLKSIYEFGKDELCNITSILSKKVKISYKKISPDVDLWFIKLVSYIYGNDKPNPNFIKFLRKAFEKCVIDTLEKMPQDSKIILLKLSIYELSNVLQKSICTPKVSNKIMNILNSEMYLYWIPEDFIKKHNDFHQGTEKIIAEANNVAVSNWPNILFVLTFGENPLNEKAENLFKFWNDIVKQIIIHTIDKNNVLDYSIYRFSQRIQEISLIDNQYSELNIQDFKELYTWQDLLRIEKRIRDDINNII